MLSSHHKLSVVDDVHHEDEGAERGVGDDGPLGFGQKDHEDARKEEDDEETTEHPCQENYISDVCGGNMNCVAGCS